MEGLPMDFYAGTITTVAVLVSRTFCWDFRREVPFAYQVLSATLGREPIGLVNTAQEEQLRGRVVEGRQRTFKAIATLWGLAADLYFCLLPFTASAFLTAPHFWAGVAGAVIIRLCASPAVHVGPADVERVLAFLNAMSVGFQYSLPRQLLPALSTGRLLLSVMFLDPWQAVNSNLLLAPLFTYASLNTETPETSVFLAIMNEAFFLLLSSLVCFYLDASLRRQESSTMKMEAKTKEAEASMTAAQKLLNVTCDACVHVTNDFRIKKPHRALLDLLAADDAEGKSLLDFVGGSDRSRFLEAFASDSNVNVDAPAKSLSLQLLDTQGAISEARFYHVQVPTFESDANGVLNTEHLLGISAIASDELGTGLVAEGRRSSRGEGDMKFLLGNGDSLHGHRVVGPSEGLTSSCITRSPRKLTWQPLKGLDNIKLTIDASSDGSVHDGFHIHAAEFKFNSKEESRHVPNLMEWVHPQARHQLQCWIQDHVNAFACGKSCDSILDHIGMLDPARPHALLAGKFIASKLMTSIDLHTVSTSEAETVESTDELPSEEMEDDTDEIFFQIEACNFITAT